MHHRLSRPLHIRVSLPKLIDDFRIHSAGRIIPEIVIQHGVELDEAALRTSPEGFRWGAQSDDLSNIHYARVNIAIVQLNHAFAVTHWIGVNGREPIPRALRVRYP